MSYSKRLIPYCLATCTAICTSMVSAEEALPAGCTELTPQAFASLASTLQESITQATLDCNAFCSEGAYAVAAQYNLELLQVALQQVQELDAWLTQEQLGTPFVTNASAAYGIHGLARDAIPGLHHARHWATISAVYHASGAARRSFDFTSRAIHQLEALGENAGTCYMKDYGPFLE